jgi:hypothetical protein
MELVLILLQTSDNGATSFLNFLLYYFLSGLLFLFLFNDYIVLWRYSYTVDNFLKGLNRIITTNVNAVINHIEQILKTNGTRAASRGDVENMLRELMEFVVIDPTTLESEGLVRKLKMLIGSYNEKLETTIMSLAPNVDRSIIQNTVNAVEGLRSLNYIYKVINHYFKLGSKYRSPYLVMQVYMLLPFLKEAVNSLSGAITTFLKGQPVGDGAGPLTAFRFLRSCSDVTAINHNVRDTYIASCSFEGRRVYVVKAQGPGGTVGSLDDAVSYLVNTMNARPRVIVTVDAALRLEGERTGSLAEGVGVAIGGIGVEKFNIESTAVRNNIPLYAILIKMNMQEALTTMPREVEDAVNQAVERVKRVIREFTRPGDEAILVGVGNTVGVAQ